jgi:hypothetical protein
METNITHIWIVKCKNSTMVEGKEQINNETRAYFSTREKAEVHFNWCKVCASSNGLSKERFYVKDEYNAQYVLNNGEFYTINMFKVALDTDF